MIYIKIINDYAKWLIYEKRKHTHLKLKRSIINGNQYITTSTTGNYTENVKVQKLIHCIVYERAYGKFGSTHIDCEFEIPPDLTNIAIIHYLMEIEAQIIHNSKFTTFTYTFTYIYIGT